jgi:hypothetical protein
MPAFKRASCSAIQGTSLALVAEVQVPSIVEFDSNGHFVTTGGIDLETFARCIRQGTRAPRMLVVIEDDLLIQGFDVAHSTPKNSCAA